MRRPSRRPPPQLSFSFSTPPNSSAMFALHFLSLSLFLFIFSFNSGKFRNRNKIISFSFRFPLLFLFFEGERLYLFVRI